MNLKSPRILEYFKFKSKITAQSFVDVLKDVPTVDFTAPHPGQMEVIKAYDERIEPSAEARAMGLEFEYAYRILTVACGRRWGKSVISSVLGAQELLIPNSQVMVVSYTLDNCEVIFKNIYKIITGLGIKLTMDRQKDMEIQLVNGSTLRVASNDNVFSKLGSSITLLIIDEAKLFARELYEQVLMPMLFDFSPLSRTILISSPETGWFETYYNRGQSDDPKWARYFSINSPTHTNPTIPREELIQMELTMPPDLYATEVLGKFTSSAGRVVREFNKETCVFDPDEFPAYYQWLHGGNTIFQSIDGGYSHYFASVWIMYVEEVDTYFMFGEYARNQTVTSEHAKAIHEFEDDNGLEVDIRYADPAAAQQIADLAEFDLYYNKADKSTTETVNNLNTLFFQISEVTGRPRLLIHKDCFETIRQLESVQWKKGRDDKQTKEKSTGVKPFQPDKDANTDWDIFDTLRYGLYSFAKNNRCDAAVFTFGDSKEDTDDDTDAMAETLNRMGYFKMG